MCKSTVNSRQKSLSSEMEIESDCVALKALRFSVRRLKDKVKKLSKTIIFENVINI